MQVKIELKLHEACFNSTWNKPINNMSVTSDLWECAVCVLCSHTSLRRGCRRSWHSPRNRDSQSSRRNAAAADSHTPARAQRRYTLEAPNQADNNPEKSATHFSHGEDEVHGRVLRVDAFQLHPLLETVLHRGHSLHLDEWEERAQ